MQKYEWHLLDRTILKGVCDRDEMVQHITTDDGRAIVVPWQSVLYREEV